MVVDSEKHNRLPFIGLFAFYSIAVPAVCVGAYAFKSYNDLSVVWLYIVQFAVLGALCYLLVVWAHVSKQARIRKRIESRKQNGGKSPWGSRRVEEPAPYSDRLATFLTASDPELEESPSDRFQSRMPFWSIFDLPQDPIEPKPIAIIRRILVRIRHAVNSQ